MISWHRVGQSVQCINDSGWIERRPWLRFLWRKTDGPADGAISTITGVEACDDGVYFHLDSHEGEFAAECFRPVYPAVIDQLRKLDVPLIERVKEDA